MKIVDIAVKKVYRFNCPNCQSRLEADIQDLEDIGGKVIKFFCPVCRKWDADQHGQVKVICKLRLTLVKRHRIDCQLFLCMPSGIEPAEIKILFLAGDCCPFF